MRDSIIPEKVTGEWRPGPAKGEEPPKFESDATYLIAFADEDRGALSFAVAKTLRRFSRLTLYGMEEVSWREVHWYMPLAEIEPPSREDVEAAAKAAEEWRARTTQGG